MRDNKDLDKVEDVKSNWLVIETFHERYYFSTIVNHYEERYLSEVVADVGYNFSDLRYCNIHDTHCVIDKTHCRIIDETEAKYYGLETTHIQHIAIDSVLILNLKEDWEGEYVWGKTNMKFGLLDIKDN